MARLEEVFPYRAEEGEEIRLSALTIGDLCSELRARGLTVEDHSFKRGLVFKEEHPYIGVPDSEDKFPMWYIKGEGFELYIKPAVSDIEIQALLVRVAVEDDEIADPRRFANSLAEIVYGFSIRPMPEIEAEQAPAYDERRV
jgi:hypothetical protein